MSAATFPAREIDPRKVERLERYLRAYAYLHAVDPLEHRRRVRAGERFLVRLRCRPTRFAFRPLINLSATVSQFSDGVARALHAAKRR